MRRLAELIATGFGTGHWPIAPATAGSAAALLLYWALPIEGEGDSVWFFVMVGAVLIAGTWAAESVSQPHDPDPKRVVADEWAGALATMAFLPVTWGWLLAGFFLFRALDILKPLGIRRLERLHGGVGIMLDDVAAGILGSAVLNGIRLLFFD